MTQRHTLLLLAGAAVLAACAQMRTPVDPPAGERQQLMLRAVGVQVYQCRANDKGHEWTFVAPDADLYTAAGQRAGRHFAGPTWEALDGSRVAATVSARMPAGSPDTIPMLLLAAK